MELGKRKFPDSLGRESGLASDVAISEERHFGLEPDHDDNRCEGTLELLA